MRNRTILVIAVLFVSCTPKKTPQVGIQPFGSFDKSLVDTVARSIIEIYGYNVVIFRNKELPEESFVNVKTPRYRADSLLRYLKGIKPDSIDYIMGLTQKDISTTKRDKYGRVKKPEYKYEDWGIFGLGYCPGPSCIISTFRIKTTDKITFISRLKKISVHELGHNLGLKHCESEKCVMKDAAEKIKTVDSVDLLLCDKCKRKIE